MAEPERGRVVSIVSRSEVAASGDPDADLIHQVRDALAHLHDLPHLQTHPLAGLVGSRSGPSAAAGKALRQGLLDAVEALRPPTGAAEGSHAWRGYRILVLRYVEALAVDAVRAQLALSSSEYYRDHRRALAAVASLLRTAATSDEGRIGGAPSGGAASGRPTAVPGRLPAPLTSFLGRERDLARLRDFLGRARFVTLTGSPGTGKTRLALELVAALADPAPVAGDPAQGSDGAVFVALAPIADPELVVPAIARALGLRPLAGEAGLEQLAAHLRGRPRLLVLDNVEQVVAAAPAVARLVAACPELRVLATSRAPLRVSGEQEVPLPPLDPEAAFRLFVERARAARPDFVPDAGAVGELCRRLDHLPLAIELAAARVGFLPPEAMLARLSGLEAARGGARDLPDRQRTLRAAIAWSHDLITDGERRVFRRLGAFVGGFTLDAAVSVAGADAAEAVEALVGHSLVQQQAGRFSMLETIREYALERLAAIGELEDAEERHATYVLALAVGAAPALVSAGQGAALDALAAELDNIRAALAWAERRSRPDLGLEIVGALHHFWHLRAERQEARAWLHRLLALPGAEARTGARARALTIAAAAADGLAEYAAGEAEAEEALAIARELDDRPLVASVLVTLALLVAYRGDLARGRHLCAEALRLAEEVNEPFTAGTAALNLAHIMIRQDDAESAPALLERAMATFRAIGNPWGIASTALNLCRVAIARGDARAAGPLYEESLALYRRIGDRTGVGSALRGLGDVAGAAGDFARAHALHREALVILRDMRETRYVLRTIEEMAKLAAAEGLSERARRLVGAADGLRAHVGSPRPPLDRRNLAAALGAWSPAAEGRTLTLDEAVALALSEAEDERA